MQVTREEHSKYMARLTPILVVAYVLQSYVYFQYFPQNLAVDITAFLGIGLVLILAGFLLHDALHQITLKDNYLDIQLKLFGHGMQKEIRYRHIETVEIIPTRFSYSHVKLTLKDDSISWLYQIDRAQELKSFILEKQAN